MRYWSRTLIGLALVVASVAASAWAIYSLVRIGSCASGGPYVSARPCPPGTGWKILMVVGSIFVVPFVGMGIFATRGGETGSGALRLGSLWWSMLWVCMGSAALLAGLGPAAQDASGVEGAAYGVGGTFLAIGLVSLLVVGAGGWGARRDRAAAPAFGGAPAPRPVPFAMPPVATGQPMWIPTPRAPAAPAPERIAERLRELDSLKAAGLVTDDEHRAKRAEILGEI